MKKSKSFLLVSIVLLGLSLFTACQQEKKDNLDDESVINNFINSRHYISLERTKGLYDNYNKRFIPEIKEIQTDSQKIGFNRKDYSPTEYSYIPLDKLKEYIKFIEALQEKNPNQKISGISVNFAAYNLNEKPDDTSKDPMDPIRKGDYRGRLTTYLTPTFYKDTEEVHIPFYIDYKDESDKFKGTFMPIKNYFNGVVENVSQEAKASSFPEVLFKTINKSKTRTKGQSVSMDEFTDHPPL